MKYLYHSLLSFIFVILFSVRAFAQEANCSQLIGNVPVTAQVETEKFFWIGTGNGLYCIRKKNNKVYHMTMENSPLLSDTITCLVAKPDGEVYIGTRKGIIRYDNYTFLRITDENSRLKSNNITSLACINSNDIYAGTFDGGITVFSGLQSKTFTSTNTSLANDHVVAIEKIGADSLVAFLANSFKVGIRHKRFTLIAGKTK